MSQELIDRAAAKEMVSETINAASQFETSLMEALMEGLDELPTVDAAPVVHARWTRVGADRKVCTACGYADRYMPQPTKFCAECGATMDGKDINVPTSNGATMDGEGEK